MLSAPRLLHKAIHWVSSRPASISINLLELVNHLYITVAVAMKIISIQLLNVLISATQPVKQDCLQNIGKRSNFFFKLATLAKLCNLTPIHSHRLVTHKLPQRVHAKVVTPADRTHYSTGMFAVVHPTWVHLQNTFGLF